MVVDLGFIDKSCTFLDSRFFPSKVGGKPAWLDLKNIPEVKDIVCKNCLKPKSFLCQIYCPFDKESAFHRMIYIFFCLSADCFRSNSSRNFIVFRNQLSKYNSFYPETPPEENINWRPDITCSKYGVDLCDICGIKYNFEINGKKYCSKYHETLDTNCKVLLPMFGLNIKEKDYSDSESCSDHDSELDQKEEFNKYNNVSKLAIAQDDPSVEYFFSQCGENTDDKIFLLFKSRIAENSEQVIRYGRNESPLWLTKQNIPFENDIPSCEYCGSKREFEFQILPQLLNYLNIDSENTLSPGILDWGTLVVYSCANSCDTGPAYKKEFIWKQDLVT